MKPTISSPGTGVQHLENFTRQLVSPSTTMPLLALGALGHSGTHELRLVRHGDLRLPFRLMLVDDALDVLPQPADDLQCRNAAVADGGVHIVQ